MLDWNGMPPGNLVHRNPQRSRQALPFKRARSVVAIDYGLHEFSIQTGSRDELIERGAGFLHVACQRFHRGSNLTILYDTSSAGLPKSGGSLVEGFLQFRPRPFESWLEIAPGFGTCVLQFIEFLAHRL